MSKFSERTTVRKPSQVRVFGPQIWADTWTDKPSEEIAIGLRSVSDFAMSLARSEAATVAWKLHPQESDSDIRIEAYNDALMRHVCVEATCDPNDINAKFFKGGIRDADRRLSSEGTKALFDCIDNLTVETSPAQLEITDQQLADLVERIADIHLLPPNMAARARRLLADVLAAIYSLDVS